MKKTTIFFTLVLLTSLAAAEIDFRSDGPIDFYNDIILQDDNNLDLNGNNIQNYFTDVCPSGEAVTEINEDGSLVCAEAVGSSNIGLPIVLDTNNTANTSIDLSGNNIENLGDPENSGDAVTLRTLSDYIQDGDTLNESLYINGNDIVDPTQIRTGGEGGDSIVIRDVNNSQDIVRFKEGEGVEIANEGLKILNGDLNITGGQIKELNWSTANDLNSDGNISQLTNVTSDDLVEGDNNQYYTDERTLDAVGNNLVGKNSTSVDYNSSSNTVEVKSIDSNASTECSGTDTYLAGDGTCQTDSSGSTSETDIEQAIFDNDNDEGNLGLNGNNIQLNGGYLSNDGNDEGLVVYDNGNVKIESGVLNLNSNNLRSAGAVEINSSGGFGQQNGKDSLRLAGHINFDGSDTSKPVIRTPGGGGDQIRIYDDANGQNIIQFNEGGNVDIPNGNIKSLGGSSSNLIGTPSDSRDLEIRGDRYIHYESDPGNDGSHSAHIFRTHGTNKFEISADDRANGNIDVKNSQLDMNGNNITSSTTGNVSIGDDLKVYGNVWTNGADLAEIYSSPQKLEKGEVVAINTGKDNSVVRTEDKFQETVTGIVSTQPGQTLNSNEEGYPIALEGKVPTKIKEGVEVERGGRIIPSKVEGKATTCEIWDPMKRNDTSLKKIISHNEDCRSSTIGKSLEKGKGEVLVKLS